MRFSDIYKPVSDIADVTTCMYVYYDGIACN